MKQTDCTEIEDPENGVTFNVRLGALGDVIRDSKRPTCSFAIRRRLHKSREAASILYSAFLASSRGFGVVISVIVVLLLSMLNAG
jgi:hypothetical protein